ncbi:MAG: hypothetical protein ABJF23_12580 [Bryobacteraceae bacterium]
MNKLVMGGATAPRRLTQKGNEMIEFGLLAMMMVPLFGGMFYSGLGLIRANQAHQVGRDVNSMYIKGIDFSQTVNKTLAMRLAGGLDLQLSGGHGLLILSQVIYIGPLTGPICLATIASGQACANHDSFVFTQRINIGDTSLYTSDLGNPSAPVNGGGIVQNYASNVGAALPNQTGFRSRWQTPLVEGQSVYVTETYFTSLNPGGAPVHTYSYF